MKYAGMIFIVVSAASVGLRMSAVLGNRCKLLREILAALQILKNEISVCGTPLPQAFALIAVSSRGAVEQLFGSMAREMDSRRWLTPVSAMEQSLQNDATFLQETSICAVLRQFAAGLGKYDRENQLKTVDRTEQELTALLRQTEQEHSLRGKTYKVLGICAGLSMVILLA